MELTDPVKRILNNYESDSPGNKANNTFQRPKARPWIC